MVASRNYWEMAAQSIDKLAVISHWCHVWGDCERTVVDVRGELDERVEGSTGFKMVLQDKLQQVMI